MNGNPSSSTKVTDLKRPPKGAGPGEKFQTETVAPCPVCGSFAQTSLRQTSSLLAVCDVLVVTFLKTFGKRIVRADRSRFGRLQGRPFYEAHTIWPQTRDHVERGLNGAWDVIPALLTQHGCCGVTVKEITACLDEYAMDLLITGTPHRMDELRYRMESRLGIAFPED